MRGALCIALALSLSAPALAEPLGAALAIERARPAAPRLDREQLPETPSLGAVSLAPDGRTLAFVRIVGDQRSLWTQAAAAQASPRRILPRTAATSLGWSADSRWLFLTDATTVRALSMGQEPGSGVIATLGGPTKVVLLGMDAGRSAVLVADEEAHRWRLWRDAPGRRPTLIAVSRRQIVDVAIGADGRVAFAKVLDGDRHLILARRGAWFTTIARCEQLRRCDFMGASADGESALMASDLAGDRMRVIRLHMDGRVDTLADDPEGRADVKRIAIDRRTGEPMIAQYLSTGPRLIGLNPAARAGLSRLRLGGILSVEPADRQWLVRQEASDQQGVRWYLFNPRDGAVRLALDDQPQRISPAKLARTIPFEFAASDGFRVNGLLTVPPGRDLRRAPIVTLVHGGPWAHDEPGYSSLTQLLANRGMIVFQPQFRGSTGFGRRYVFAANGDYGDGRVQRDIEDGTRWLLARGIGNPAKAAIMGASFGGYSTLQSLSNGSNLYSAGIAIVPPTDFGWIIGWAADRTDLGEAQGVRFGAVQRVMGLNRADPAVVGRLHQQSPKARVGRMNTPLLLLAAGRDERVPIRTVIDYAAALKARRAPARVIVAARLTHSGKNEMGGKASLFLVEDMLARQWHLPAATPPSSRVKRWMSTNLRSL